MKRIMLLVCLGVFSSPAFAEDTKMNMELTAYIPGFGVEYQLDDTRTLGLNYSAFKSVNVNMTSYNDGVFNGGYFNNVFLGYGDDGSNSVGLFTLGKYMYAGAVFGYQWDLDNGVNINADAGLMLVAFNLFDSNNQTEFLPLPAFALSVGYAFSLGD